MIQWFLLAWFFDTQVFSCDYEPYEDFDDTGDPVDSEWPEDTLVDDLPDSGAETGGADTADSDVDSDDTDVDSDDTDVDSDDSDAVDSDDSDVVTDSDSDVVTDSDTDVVTDSDTDAADSETSPP